LQVPNVKINTGCKARTTVDLNDGYLSRITSFAANDLQMPATYARPLSDFNNESYSLASVLSTLSSVSTVPFSCLFFYFTDMTK
jgi:hypothetical protein